MLIEFHSRLELSLLVVCWLEIIQEAEKYGALEGSTSTNKIWKPYSSCVALMCDLVDKKPSSYEEAAQKKEWVEAMTKEYQ